jgi:hypothetical protein
MSPPVVSTLEKGTQRDRAGQRLGKSQGAWTGAPVAASGNECKHERKLDRALHNLSPGHNQDNKLGGTGRTI